MKELERTIENYVVQYAKRQGVLVTKMKLDQHAGFPDRVFWLPGGRPLLIEFKRPGGKPSALQVHTIAKLERLGYEVKIAETRQEGCAHIAAALKARAMEATPLPGARRKVRAAARSCGLPA